MSPCCRINFLQIGGGYARQNTGVLIGIKARVAATSTSAVARSTGSVITNVCSESSPVEEMSEVTTSEPISDTVNQANMRDQPMVYVKLTTMEWEPSQE